MAAAEWWCWPLPAWLGSSAAWFVLLNIVVGAIFALSSRAQPQSPSPRRGITRRASFSIFSFPSSSFHTDAAPDSPATFRGTEYAGTRGERSPSTPRAVAPLAASELTAPAKQEDEEEDVNSMSMDDVYALVLAGRNQPPPTEEEAARSEVDAKAEEFIRGFKEDLRQQRLNSIFNYTQMLKRSGGGRIQSRPGLNVSKEWQLVVNSDKNATVVNSVTKDFSVTPRAMARVARGLAPPLLKRRAAGRGTPVAAPDHTNH